MLKRQIKVALLFFTIVPLIVVGAIAVPRLFVILSHTGLDETRTYASVNSKSIEDYFNSVLFSQASLAHEHSVRSVLTTAGAASAQCVENANRTLSDHTSSAERIDALMIVDENNIVKACSLEQFVDREFTLDRANTNYSDKGFSVSPVYSPSTLQGFPWQHDELLASAPLMINGVREGRIVVFSNLGYFEDLVKLTKTRDISLLIFDSDNQLVAEGSSLLNSDQLAAQQDQSFTKKIEEIATKKDSKDRTFSVVLEKGHYKAYVHKISDLGWTVVGLCNTQKLYQPLVSLIIWIGLLCAFVIVVAFFGARFFSQKVFGPLEQDFLPTIYKVASGDREAKVEYEGADEMGMVGRALNDLIADLDEREQELSASEARYRMIIEGSRNVVFEWHEKTDLLDVSPIFAERFGYELPKTHVAPRLFPEEYIYPDDLPEYEQFCRDVFIMHNDAETTIRLKKTNGRYLWAELRALAQFNTQQQYLGFVGVLTDVDQAKREELRLSEEARTDPLSKVLNRRAFEELAQATLKAEHGSDERVALFFLDIDNFKNFNTTYGHAFGDRVIRFFGHVMREVSSPRGFAGRLGGDEFALCLTLSNERGMAQTIIEDIRHRLSTELTTREEEAMVISASIGVAFAPRDGSTYEELMRISDLKMYEDKQGIESRDRLAELKRLNDEGLEIPT